MNRFFSKWLFVGMLALTVCTARAQTSVTAGTLGIIHGPGDLDLTGEFVYAINFSADEPPVIVEGLTFVPDRTPPEGAVFVGPNEASPWETRPDFGDSPSADNLERVYKDIRWANNGIGERLEAHLPVTPGETYKLQVLFYEGKQNSRRWDIEVEGVLSVDQVSSLGATTLVDDFITDPEYDPTAGVVFTQVITATDATLDVVFGQVDGNTDGNDLNPIWQGLTLERVLPDTDNDGLPDAWETATFGNLGQTAAGDGDGDGISNSVELNLGLNAAAKDTDGDGLEDGDEFNVRGTNPKVADTDGDGLSDGAEVNTHQTNPLSADTDLDGLSDAAELSTHNTDPRNPDSDNDGYPDGVEIANGANPTNAASFPLLSSFPRVITGGDAEEGLDLTGTFKYAFNVGPNGAPGVIRGVNFTDETNDGAGGVTISPGQEIEAWDSAPDLGPSDDDMNLATLLWSIRHAGANNGKITVTLDGLTAGKPYKLQLLFMERCCARGFDILVDGELKLDDFAPYIYQDTYQAGTIPTRGSVAVIGFLASGPSVEIVLDGAGVTTPQYTDRNPILNGVTLEELSSADTDGDGLEDLWEVANFGNLNQTAAGDPDQDGLPNSQEYLRGTDPNKADTDEDGLTDGAEVNTHQTNPRAADSDGDGLSDSFEIQTSLSDPLKSDTDGDGYGDAIEHARGTGVNNAASYPFFGASVGSFTGGDPGEGLDLAGTFKYAVNISSGGPPPGPIGEANFTGEDEPGVLVDAFHDVLNWTAPAYGDTENDDNLEYVMQSMRYSDAPATPSVELSGLTVGKTYKLQLLFAEQCCAGRGFDIELNGVRQVDDFIPSVPQGGAGNTARGAVVTIGFVAKNDTVNVILNGNKADSPAITDRNAIINALTLEEVTLPDTDGDGLADAWETQFFGDLTRAGTADSDGDGAVNSAEYAAGTDPDNPDTDGDGLNDGAEAARGTDPLAPDSDADGLPDGMEVNTLQTNPLLADTDGDTFTDGAEILTGSNPLLAASVPPVDIGVFTGGDPGEGLDLTGAFVYAFNVGTNPVSGQAGDAVFTADNAAGITVTAPNQIPDWHNPDYGETPEDSVIENVMRSIRWSQAPNVVRVDLANLTPGQKYKAQLLFAETGFNRGFDVIAEGATIVEDFYPGVVQEGVNTQGVVIAFEFTAPDPVLNVVLNGVPTEAVDKNPILSGMTLEALGAPPVTGDFSLAVASVTDAGITFTARGPAGKAFALDYSPSLTAGSWVVVNGSVVIAAGGTAEVTDAAPAHLTPGTGFWRLRDPALKPQP